MIEKQKTIKKKVSFDGVGIHSGLKSSITLKPLPIDSGIIIRSVHFPFKEIRVGKIVPEDIRFATVIKNDDWQIGTIEHLMAALNALEIDNILIETNGIEVPIMDGSAKPFVIELLKVGFNEQDAKKEFITPKEVLFFVDEENDRSIEIVPAKKNNGIDKKLYFSYKADFEQHLIGEEKIDGELSDQFFTKEIAPARTFGFLNQLPFMRKRGLAKGASLDNTVIIGKDGFLNKPRFRDELVRHKFLDFVGDLALLGVKLIGTVNAKRTGHSFNHLVVKHCINNPDKWEVIR